MFLFYFRDFAIVNLYIYIYIYIYMYIIFYIKDIYINIKDIYVIYTKSNNIKKRFIKDVSELLLIPLSTA